MTNGLVVSNAIRKQRGKAKVGSNRTPALDAEEIDTGRHGVNVAPNLAMQTAALENILTATREQEQRHELKGSTGHIPEIEKPAAGEGAAGFPKRTEQRLGRRSAAVPTDVPSGGGVGHLNLEALREEEHRFD
ncbi:hypothetical protein [Rhizobium phaseoli]|uniref:hypothetical protein n=1 Tax=Rhizobium phaseoli TaxID=396 RepID=UPI0011414D0E|nr:hypothetical protein [Rhizobium phaseoli]